MIVAGSLLFGGCDSGEEGKSEKASICTPVSETYTTSRSGIGVSLCDMNNDRSLDLIVASPSGVSIYTNKDGTFE